MQCLKAMYRPELTWQVSIFDSKIFLAICFSKKSFTVLLANRHGPLLSCYLISVKKQSKNRSVDAIKISLPSISKICPEIQVLSFHGSDSTYEVDELPDEHWAKTMQWKKLQLQSMPNAMMYFDKRFAVKNSGISCLALIFDPRKSENDNPARKKSVQGGDIKRVIYRCFSLNWYELMA